MRARTVTTKDKYALLLVVAIFVLASLAYFVTNDFTVILFNITVLCAGLWMFIVIASAIGISLKSKSWDKCRYKVVESTFSMQMGGGRIQTQYFPFFTIQYLHEGRIYTKTSEENLNLSTRYVFYTPHEAQKYLDDVAAFLYGDELYVNPKDPKIAYLRTGIGRNQLAMLVFSLLLVVLPTLTLLGLIEWR